MMCNIKSFLLIIVLTSVCAAQPPDILWTRTFNRSSWDTGESVELTPDGGCIVVGSTCMESVYSDFWVLRLDSQGDILWEVITGEDYEIETPFCVRNTSDGGFMVVGETSVNASGYLDMYMIKFDSTGNIEWDASHGTSRSDRAKDVLQTQDGGYILVGNRTYVGSEDFMDVLVVKTDSLGGLEWISIDSASTSSEANAVLIDENEEYVITGYFHAPPPDSSGFCSVIWMDSFGNITNQLLYGGVEHDEGQSICYSHDEGYVIAGFSLSFGNEYQGYVIGIDNAGNLLWETVAGNPQNDQLSSIIQGMCGVYVATGRSESFQGDYDMWLISIYSSGNLQWETRYDFGESEFASSLEQTSDGGFILCGTSSQSGNNDILVVRTAPPTGITNGTSTSTGSSLIMNSNPCSRNPEFIAIIEEECIISLDVFDVLGRIVSSVYSGYISSGSHNLNSGVLPSGLYMARLSTEKETLVLKFMVVD